MDSDSAGFPSDGPVSAERQDFRNVLMQFRNHIAIFLRHSSPSIGLASRISRLSILQKPTKT